MRPSKAKDLIPKVAKELSLSERLVEDVVDFYWRDVRRNLVGLANPRIHLTNLGDFTIKHWKIDDKIQMLEKFEENNRQKGLQQMTARFKTAETLFGLKAIKKMVEEEAQRKDFIKLHKNSTNVSVKECSDDMEEQGPYSRGCNQ